VILDSVTHTAGDIGSPLRALADRAGILPDYIDQEGHRRPASDETRVALLATMGFDASSGDAARRALATLDAVERDAAFPSVLVARRGDLSCPVRHLGVSAGRAEWDIEARAEDGTVHRRSGAAAVGADGGCVANYPQSLKRAEGYFDVRITVRILGDERTATQRLILTPWRCLSASKVLGRRTGFGHIANLYSVRSERNWGVGDLADLRALALWSATLGGDFVGVNPLHALFNRGHDVSPYSPVSRLFRNPMYLAVEEIPEWRASAAARAMAESESVRDALARARASDRVDYAAIRALQVPLLRALHQTFVADHRGRTGNRTTQRGRAYEAYRLREGIALDDFATFMAIDDHITQQQGRSMAWTAWPSGLRDPRSEAVRAFRERNAESVDCHRWCQFELDRQLERSQTAARGAGMAIGLYQDLAIGAALAGSDTWANQTLFARGATVGAPPDLLAPQGQNWGLPPLNPHALRRDGYRFWTEVLRASLRHAGALRIDHVLGLFRLFWIPDGKQSPDGAYVRYPSDDLLGILALESVRAGAVVIGEDLGTLPEELPHAMRQRRMLSSKVFYFERTSSGGFNTAASYPRDALATANTHDLPTIDAFWVGHDITLREQTGVIDAEGAARARAGRAGDRAVLAERLNGDGMVEAGSLAATGDPPGVELRAAVHRFLCATPALLVGLSLDDIAGEIEPVNLPGVTQDQFPNWTRRLSRDLVTLGADADVQRLATCGRGSTKRGR
jgi:4-alpha-glucanotransferase